MICYKIRFDRSKLCLLHYGPKSVVRYPIFIRFILRIMARYEPKENEDRIVLMMKLASIFSLIWTLLASKKLMACYQMVEKPIYEVVLKVSDECERLSMGIVRCQRGSDGPYHPLRRSNITLAFELARHFVIWEWIVWGVRSMWRVPDLLHCVHW